MTPIALALGAHFAVCPRTGLLPRRGFVLQRAWVHVLCEAVGPEGRVVPQQWLANTTVRGVAVDDRQRLDFVVYGATLTGNCGATLDSFFTQAGQPSSGSANRDGAMPEVACRRKVACYPELCRGGPQRLCVLAVGSRWNDTARQAPRSLAQPARASGLGTGGSLSAAVQEAVGSAALGAWAMPSLPADGDDVYLADLLQLADPAPPSRLPP